MRAFESKPFNQKKTVAARSSAAPSGLHALQQSAGNRAVAGMLALQRVDHLLESPPSARGEVVEGTFDRDPLYLDNFTGGGFEVLTGLFRLMYADGRAVDFRYADVIRQLRTGASESALLPAAADTAAGSRTVRLAVRFTTGARTPG
ncbi:hypothetical protein BBK82_25075 [Lentzea guizhouensis]|uniref:Uncharacterized protein n=1 Tax=Lentzea guizhouensis TaxID=1586287 RepID=A0A1B2HMA7_9PSEU|nr:hypothetical protein [Lentzea guizhouensis]ANZ38853.1 hypothetical protein BBK82_25075 [Lentzea guizhouensis]